MTSGVEYRKRMIGLLAIITLLFFVLLGRFVWLQIVDAAWLQERGEQQWERTVTLPAYRGRILDTTGKALAQSGTTYTITVDPSQVAAQKTEEQLASILSEYLELDPAETLEKIKDTSRSSVTIKRQVERETAESLKQLRRDYAAKIADEKRAKLVVSSNPMIGVYYTEDFRRYYPMGEVLAQTLGITNVDGIGQSGLEAYYNEALSGKAGSARVEVDGVGREVAEYETIIEAEAGKDIQLTVDYVMQSFAERVVDECMEETGAARAICIVMDTKTGGILAMTGKPDFDPNAPPRNDMTLLTSVLRNRAVSDSYEPGSVLGVFTLASALDSGAISLESLMDCEGISYVENEAIPCWHDGHGEQELCTAAVMGCSTALAQVALALGKTEFYASLSAYGFGEQSNIDLPSESAGKIRSSKYVKLADLAQMGLGEDIACTPLQLVRAASSLVNGGSLMQPYVVSQIIDAEGETSVRNEPVMKETPIRASTSDSMRSLLAEYVENGYGSNARVPGYSVGGFGGNAHKYSDGKLVSNSQISMFIGMAPMNDPQVTVLMAVEAAENQPDYAHTLSAPYVSRILEQALPYMGIAPVEATEEEEAVTMANLVGSKMSSAISQAEAQGLRVVSDSEHGTVRAQLPAQGETLREGDTIALMGKTYLEVSGSDYQTVVPDISDLNVLKANALLKDSGLSLRIDGIGYAVMQMPAAGTMVDAGSTVVGYFMQMDAPAADTPGEEAEYSEDAPEEEEALTEEE